MFSTSPMISSPDFEQNHEEVVIKDNKSERSMDELHLYSEKQSQCDEISSI